MFMCHIEKKEIMCVCVWGGTYHKDTYQHLIQLNFIYVAFVIINIVSTLYKSQSPPPPQNRQNNGGQEGQVSN